MRQFVVCLLVLVLAVIYVESICMHNGIRYRTGETYQDDCNTCRCAPDGNGACTRKGCPPKVCRYNGKKYGAGEQYIDEDGCNKCTCNKNGESACTQKLCL